MFEACAKKTYAWKCAKMFKKLKSSRPIYVSIWL